MKAYKPLLSSAPTYSILNAQAFRYRNSSETDIRKTFERARRNTRPQTPTNVHAFPKQAGEDAPPSLPVRQLVRSSR